MEEGESDYGLPANNSEARGIACASSMPIQQSSTGDGIELDNLNFDGTVRVGSAGPSAQDQDQITSIPQINQGGSGGANVKEGEDSDQGSTIDAQCRPCKDFVRLFTCGLYLSTKGQDRGRSHDATPKIVDVPEGSRISPTYREPQEPPPPPQSPPPPSKLPWYNSVTPTRCTLQ